jgi:hypothetical protein
MLKAAQTADEPATQSPSPRANSLSSASIEPAAFP